MAISHNVLCAFSRTRQEHSWVASLTSLDRLPWSNVGVGDAVFGDTKRVAEYRRREKLL